MLNISHPLPHRAYRSAPILGAKPGDILVDTDEKARVLVVSNGYAVVLDGLYTIRIHDLTGAYRIEPISTLTVGEQR